MSHMLITDTILPQFENPVLSSLDDGAVLNIRENRLAFSSDGFVVDPIFFPGGNIGELAINGTVNDIAMCGAVPLFLSVGFIIEEGFLMDDLKTIISSMKNAAEKANVKIATGDTKVVPKGACDKIFIHTSGVGLIPENVHVGGHLSRPGDKIILSGYMADHGIAVLTSRNDMDFETDVISDTAPLNHMVSGMLNSAGDPGNIHVLRDPTRGGVGTALNEIAKSSNVGIRIYEQNLPVRDNVRGICNLLGFDPLYIANEGKLLAFVAREAAENVLETIQKQEYGKNACIIGETVSRHPGKVFMKTRIGGERIVDMLAGEQLPRIC
jgi:hydrogenase expression/formation protein HypE